MFIESLLLLVQRASDACDLWAYVSPLEAGIHTLRTNGEGWIRYDFTYKGASSHGYVSPHFNVELAKQCNADELDVWHKWEGQWSKTPSCLTCRICGVEGT